MAKSVLTIVDYKKELPYIEDRQPWEPPESYLVKSKTKPNEYEEVQGRRPSKMFLVNKIRAEVDKWRKDGYPGTTEASQKLLSFWFDESHPPIFGHEPFHFYFCQQEAVETIIYLYEVKKFKDIKPVIKKYNTQYTGTLIPTDIEFGEDTEGNRTVKRYFPEKEQEDTQKLSEENLLRYAIKMATGSGKTFIMAFIVVWSYFNNSRGKNKQYANNFLIIAPNIIVYERLSKDFQSGRIFEQFPFIPPEWKSRFKLNYKFRNDDSPLAAENNLILNNVHQIYEKPPEETPENIIEQILGKRPAGDSNKPPDTLLDRLKELGNLLVINDEAHHVHDDDLKWNESLLTLHHSIPGGLKLWLDFSATPKTPDNKDFPWIVSDYPLVQAVEDRIVKVPLIVHTVNKKDPEKVTNTNFTQKYSEWIVAALDRYKQHFNSFKKVDKKPILFIMADNNKNADILEIYIKKKANNYGIAENEIMTIHTDNTGEIKKSELEALRDIARNVDSPDNKIKVIISVLMLREGWDVQNVTIVLGLRTFESAILPEQAIGRGLRLMRSVSPDRTQTLEIIGNDKFERIVKDLEHEGFSVSSTNTPPPAPATIAPMRSRFQYDIEIPGTDRSFNRTYKNLSSLDISKFPSLYNSNVLRKDKKIEIKIADLNLDIEVERTVIENNDIEFGSDLMSFITSQVQKRANLTDCFNELYPLCEKYVLTRCFETKIDNIEKINLRKQLRDTEIQQSIIDLLSKEIGKATIERQQITVKGKPIHLKNTPQFHWRRGHTTCTKTVFNYVATYNSFETEFAQFLDKAPDVTAFSALENSGFHIDYLSDRGAIRNYFPDFVAMQKSGKNKVFWILETKGREYEDLANKNKAIERWCKSVSEQTGISWRFLLIKQAEYNRVKSQLRTLQDCFLKLQPQKELKFQYEEPAATGWGMAADTKDEYNDDK